MNKLDEIVSSCTERELIAIFEELNTRTACLIKPRLNIALNIGESLKIS